MDSIKIRNNEKQLQALTSLTTAEFDELLIPFTHRFEQKFRYFKMNGKRRKKPQSYHAVRSDTRVIPTVVDKFLFILYHFKIDTIQFAEAAFFGLSQGQTSRWTAFLRPVLMDAIEDLHLQPARNIDELIRLFRNRQHKDSILDKPESKTLHLDATEREITRSVDYEAQKFDYSGKQKQHTVKNSVINDEFRFVHYVGPSHRGAMHDKRMITEEIENFDHSTFQDQWLTKDTGFQGYNPTGVNLLAPYKKRKNIDLTKIQKEFNTWVSSIRAVSENAIGSMKALRRLKHRARRFNLHVADIEAAIAAGLNNLRVTRRRTSYEAALSRVRANL
jgi:hypothetical protein